MMHLRLIRRCGDAFLVRHIFNFSTAICARHLAAITFGVLSLGFSLLSPREVANATTRFRLSYYSNYSRFYRSGTNCGSRVVALINNLARGQSHRGALFRAAALCCRCCLSTSPNTKLLGIVSQHVCDSSAIPTLGCCSSIRISKSVRVVICISGVTHRDFPLPAALFLDAARVRPGDLPRCGFFLLP